MLILQRPPRQEMQLLNKQDHWESTSAIDNIRSLRPLQGISELIGAVADEFKDVEDVNA